MRSHHKFNEHEEAPRIKRSECCGEKTRLSQMPVPQGMVRPARALAGMRQAWSRCGKFAGCVTALCRLLWPPARAHWRLRLRASPLRRQGHASSPLSAEPAHSWHTTPKRLQRTLCASLPILSSKRRACVSCEISKLNETQCAPWESQNYFRKRNRAKEIATAIEGDGKGLAR